MTTTFNLGDDIAAKISRQMVAGDFKSPEAVMNAALDALAVMQTDAEQLRRLIAEADADVAAGRVARYANADELVADILAAGDARSSG